MAGVGGSVGETAGGEPRPPIIQYVPGGFHVRCPFCLQRLFTSDVPTWRAVLADDPAPKLAIKCAQRRGGERCGRILVLTWVPEFTLDAKEG